MIIISFQTIESGLVVENIYAVMIWLHGGTYMTGDGMDSFVGDVLALQGPVIIVTLNYRYTINACGVVVWCIAICIYFYI